MPAVKPDLFFTADSKVRHYYANPIVEGHRVQAGDSVVVDIGHDLLIETRVQSDGWHLRKAQESAGVFVTDQELNRTYSPAAMPRGKDLPRGTAVRAVVKGERIVVHPWGDVGVQTIAPADGFVVTMPCNGKRSFMSQIGFSAAFNDKTAVTGNQQGHYRRKIPATSVLYRAVVVEKPVTLTIGGAQVKVNTGDVLVEMPAAENTYKLMTAAEFAAQMQEAPEIKAQPRKASSPREKPLPA